MDGGPDAAARLVQRRRREAAVRRQARDLADELGNEDYHETFVRDETRALLIAYRYESACASRMVRCADIRASLRKPARSRRRRAQSG